MSEWKELNKKTLSELVVINNGIDYKSNPKGDKIIPIYGTGGIMGYTTIALNEGPAILSGRKGSINRPFYVEGKFWNVDTIFCLKPLNDNDAKWLYYSLLNEDMTKLNEATGVPSVTSKSLYKLRINYVQPETQKRISQILTTCDTVIEQTQAAIEKYKAIKQGMLHDLFTRGLTASGQLRPTPQQAPELYKQSELGLIPKEWEVKRLEEIATIHSGIDYKKNPQGEDVPIYGTGGIMGYTSMSLNEGPAVLTGRKGSINRPFYVEGKFWNVDTIFCLKTIGENNSKWLYYNILRINMNRYNEATGVPSITSKTLNKLSFCHYSKNEQDKIIELINPIDTKLQSEEALLSKYQSIKKGLMSDLLSGKREVWSNRMKYHEL